MIRLFSVSLVIALLQFSPRLTADVLHFHFEVFNGEQDYGSSDFWVSDTFTRFDLNIPEHYHKTEYVSLKEGVSQLYDHELKTYVSINDQEIKARVKKQINFTGSDEEFDQLVLATAKEEGFPDYLTFKQESGELIAEYDGENLFIVTPITDKRWMLSAKEKNMLSMALNKRQRMNPPEVGMIEVLPPDIMFFLLDNSQFGFAQYHNKLYEKRFRLKSVERLKTKDFSVKDAQTYRKLSF